MLPGPKKLKTEGEIMESARKAIRQYGPWGLALLIVLPLLLLWCATTLAQPKAVKRDQGTAATVRAGDVDKEAGELYCLVVGVSRYANTGIPKLNLAVKDAKDFGAFIKTQGKYLKKVHVKELLDQDATKYNIERYLMYDLRKAGQKDTVILYFSGHGSIDTKFAGDYFFLSYDADPDFPVITAVQLSRNVLFNRIPANKVLVVLDACHSGTPAMHKNIQTRSTGDSLRGFLEQFRESQGQLMITSSSPNEYAMEFPDLPNGVFTHFLLEGLRGKADADVNGIVSAREAYDYAYENTKTRTQGAQHPAWSGDMSGTFPLALLKPPGGTLELVTDPPEVTVSRKDDSGFSVLGKTDRAGKLTITGLAVGKPLFFRFAKEGWDDLVPDPIIVAPNAKEIEKYPVKLTPRLAHVTVRTNVPGVTVRLDDVDRGQTDDTSFMFLDNIQVSVPHELVLKKEGFHERKVSLIIPPKFENRVFRWEGTLDAIPQKKREPAFVEVAISTVPTRVQVFVGDSGKPAGTSDSHGHLRLPLQGPGEVVLHFRKSGHVQENREVTLPPEGSVLLSTVRLRQIEPTVKLFVDQAGAQVFVKRARGKAVKREDTESGYEYAGETDAKGMLTVRRLPLGVPVMLKIRKAGWKDKIVGPIVLSEDNWIVDLPLVALERMIPEPEPQPRPVEKVTSTDLMINTDPSDVSIVINGEYKGDTDKSGEIRIKGVPVEKPHKIVFKKYGYVPIEKTVSLPAVSSARLDMVVLNRLLTRVEVSASQPFADVLARHSGDYELAGRTDSVGKAVLEGLPLNKSIALKVKKEGWREKSLGTVRLTDQQPQVKLPEAKMEPALAVVKIRTDPSGVVAKLNGQQTKESAGSMITLTGIQVVTDHDIELSRKGYLAKHVYLHVPAEYEGRTYYMEKVELERAYARLELRTNHPDVTVRVDGTVEDKTDKDGNVVVKKVPIGVPLTVEFEKQGFVKKSIRVTVPNDYEGVAYKRKEAVYLDAEPRPTEQTAKSNKEKPRSEPASQERPRYQSAPEPSVSWPSDSGSRQDSLPSGSASFPSDFTN